MMVARWQHDDSLLGAFARRTYREGRFVEGPNPWIRFFLGAMGPRQAFPGVAGLLIGLAGFALIAYGQVLNGAVFHVRNLLRRCC